MIKNKYVKYDHVSVEDVKWRIQLISQIVHTAIKCKLCFEDKEAKLIVIR